MKLIKHFYFSCVFSRTCAGKSIKPMLRIVLLLFISFFVFTATSAQTPNTEESSFRKYGIGVGYGFNSPLNEDLHPFEVSLQYRPNTRHTIYLTIPFLKKQEEHASGTPYTTGDNVGWSVINMNDYLWGIELGYHYSMLNYRGISLFAGAGLSYQSLDSETHSYGWTNYLFLTDRPHPSYHLSTSGKEVNAYSFVPQAGLKYTWKGISVEFKYKPWFSTEKYWFDVYKQVPETAEFNYLYNQNRIWYVKNGFACSLFFYF